ncbi:MAG: PTS sugar transporter subunit IIB [Alphaproteobacteria bacterium]|jgi:PTS system ascorbate-specific IIB component|nr:PTS sugar transporter subunit IIB [Alphaproteobacteria bacterium]
MKILAVCSFGVGSSMVLKMQIEKALKELNIKAEVETADLPTAASMNPDLIFTSPEFASEIKERVACPVIPIKKFMDYAEVMQAIKDNIGE